MKTTDLEHDQAQLAPLLSETLRKHRRGRIGCSWYVDETFRYCWPTRFLEFVKLLGALDREGKINSHYKCYRHTSLLPYAAFLSCVPRTSIATTMARAVSCTDA